MGFFSGLFASGYLFQLEIIAQIQVLQQHRKQVETKHLIKNLSAI